jgi:hypothetical protein
MRFCLRISWKSVYLWESAQVPSAFFRSLDGRTEESSSLSIEGDLMRARSSNLICLVLALGFLSGCGAVEDEVNGSRGHASVPKVTGAVGTVGSSSLRPLTTSILLSDMSGCAGCSAQAQMAFGMAYNFVSIGRVADNYSCIIQALVNDGVIPGDGVERVLVTPDNSFSIKIAVQSDGTRISSFKLYTCPSASATSNDTYIYGTTSDDGTTTIRNKVADATSRNAMTVTGNFLDGVWSNKTVSMEYAVTGGSGLFEMTQGTSNMILRGVLQFGAANYLYSKFKLLGDNPDTYALGEGSMKSGPADPAGAITNHWGDSGVDTGATPSM